MPRYKEVEERDGRRLLQRRTKSNGLQHHQGHPEERPTRYKLLILVLLISWSVSVLYREFSLASKTVNNGLPAAQQQKQAITPVESTELYQYVPCQISEISILQENTTRFQATPVDSWKCRQEVSDSYWLIFVDFQIKECPPNYASSTFQLEGSTSRSRIMGQISDRYLFKYGCGLYNASVAIMDHPLPVGESQRTVTMELNWTSGFRKYSNHLKDIQDAHTIKAEQLETEQIQAMFTSERLQYLQRHLQPLFQRQLQVTLQEPQKQYTPTTLPDCGTIPMSQWEPAGIFEDVTYNDTSPFTAKDAERQWPFRSARCNFPARTLDQLNELLAGIRIFSVGDSHADNLLNEVRALQCPEWWISNWDKFWEANYDCPFRNNTWIHAYRFFRGVFQPDMKRDMDAISGNLRQGSEKSCQQILGLGLYNATILFVPHWLFVYETQEGVDDFVLALKSLMINCRKSHAEQMKGHLVFVQTPTARDYLPFVKDTTLDLNPAHSWRGIHNHRLDAMTQHIKKELNGLVDGIIPAFEMTLPRMKTDQTRDGVHLPTEAYRELFHVHVAAVRSGMKYKRGLELPLMKPDHPKARWFVNQPFEWPLR